MGLILFTILGIDCTTNEWQLVWSDKFDGQYLNRTLWEVEDEWNRRQCTRAKELNLLNCYADQRRNIHLINGTLAITPAREWSTYSQKELKAYTSAVITSRANWTYGRFEIRASLPQGKMLTPAIYMESVNGSLHLATNGFIELVTNRQEQSIVGGGYYGQSNTNDPEYPIGGNSTRLGDFHTYTLEWTPGWMRWSRGIDFNISRRLSDDYDRPFRLVINLFVGGNTQYLFPGQTLTDDDYRGWKCSAIIVDYVRVYQWSHVDNVTESTPQFVESHVNNVTVIKTLPADRLYSGHICEAAMAYVNKNDPDHGAITLVYLIAGLVLGLIFIALLVFNVYTYVTQKRLKAKNSAELNGDGDKLTEITLNDSTVNYCV
ncbi:unnamed protein product [Medioppia subpectinata]|uniref:GH16 domain-containing protein n=1 Tax=Medioppia subpectinata TaxID=1979941 RepID=A0A7R9KGE8_9ACAR|nr:unnamed protein product [Medioppia subpectinata]CAG2103064.1 unnamed protein product [Medioppia subpectinata]